MCHVVRLIQQEEPSNILSLKKDGKYLDTIIKGRRFDLFSVLLAAGRE
jgi:hypothetical protein